MSKKRWFETADEIVDDLLTQLSEEDKKTIKLTHKEDLINLHFGLGMHIRNKYGLLGDNKKLVKSVCGDFGHTDNASDVIIEKLWFTLQKNDS